jgi:transcriptional regulator with XRE-family HTH domain
LLYVSDFAERFCRISLKIRTTLQPVTHAIWNADRRHNSPKVSKRTIVDFERGARSPHASTLFAIQTAFEAAGIEFIHENGGGAGLRFRDRA